MKSSRLHRVFSGQEAKPMGLGLEGSEALAFVGALVAGFGVFVTLKGDLPLMANALLSACLPLGCLAYIVTLKKGKPARHDREAIDYVGFRAKAALTDQQRSGCPPKLFHGSSKDSRQRPLFAKSLEDVFIVDGHLVAVESSAVRIAKGFAAHLPGMENAEVSVLNQYEDAIRAFIRSASPQHTIQYRWTLDQAGALEPLLRYYQDTKERSTSDWATRQRNAIFTRHHEDHEQGRIRLSTIEIYLSLTQKTGSGSVDYDSVLQGNTNVFEQFYRQLETLARQFGGRVESLEDRALFESCFGYFNPRPESMDAVPFDKLLSLRENCLLGEAVPLEVADHGFYYQGRYWSAVLMRRMPSTTFMGMMVQMTGLDLGDIAMVVNTQAQDTRAIIVRKEKEIEKLERNFAHNRKPRIGASIERLRQDVVRLTSDEVVPCAAQSMVIVRAESKEQLRSRIEQVRNAIFRLNGAVPYEPAFPTSVRNYVLAGLPGNVTPYADSLLEMEDHHLADFLPLSGTPTADLANAEAIFDGAHGNLMGIQTFDRGNPNHCIATGLTGSGKSMLLANLLTQTAPYYGRTFIIDHGNSYGDWAKTMGNSTCISVRSNGSETFNYFDTQGLPLTPAAIADATATAHLLAGHNRDEDQDQYRSALLSSTIADLYRDAFDEWVRTKPARLGTVTHDWLACTRWAADQETEFADELERFEAYRAWVTDHPDESAALNRTLNADDLGNPCEEIMRHGFAFMDPSDYPTHSNLYELLLCEGRSADPEAEAKLVLARLLQPWCRAGQYGCLVDGASNVSLETPIVHIEWGSIQESEAKLRQVTAFLVTNFIRKIVMSRPRGERKRIILEELSAFLSMPDGERIAREFYERMRKYSCWCVSVFQQLQTIENQAVLRAIVSNSKMALVLKQSDRAELERLSESIPLPESTIETILSFPEPDPENGAYFAYIKTGARRPQITIGRNVMTPEAYALSTTTGEEYEARTTAGSSAATA